MTYLSKIQAGNKLKILNLPDEIRAELIRMGLCIGEELCCTAKIPNGPVVVKKDLQEIAIGHNFAKAIEIEIQ